MKTNLIMVNTNLYVILGNLIYRLDNGEFKIPSNLEIKNVKDKLERNKFNLFKSSRINKIASRNPELKRIDVLEDVLDDVEKTIPFKYRKSFYKNLETLKIKFVYYSPVAKNHVEKDSKIYSPACYCPGTNEIIIAVKEMRNEKNVFSKFQSNISYTYKDELKGTLIHELFHMASRNLDNRINIYVTGIITVDDISLEILNRSLNEGITECQRKKIHTQDESIIKNNYNLQVAITNQLNALIGEDVMLDSYYNSKNTKVIEKKLLEIINDKELIDEIIDSFSYISFDSCSASEIENASYIQSLLLDLFEAKIRLCIEHHDTKQIKRIVKILEENFIDIKIDGKRLETLFSNYNLDTFNHIKYTEARIRKRKKEK